MRQVTNDDHAILAEALKVWQDKAHMYPLAADTDLTKALSYVILNQKDCYIGHGFCLMVAEYTPWYSTAKLLQEEFVLSLPRQDSYNLPAVITFLKQLAVQRGATGVVAGNSSPDKRLSILYKRKRFEHASEVFTFRI